MWMHRIQASTNPTVEAAEKAKMAQAEEAQRAEVARLMETLTPAQVGAVAPCRFNVPVSSS